jgi:type IV pilus assembly protein PilM
LQLSQDYGCIGVDIGTHTVKLAQVVRDGGGARLHRAAVIQRPASWIGDDALAWEQPLSSHPQILAALECGGFSGRDAICSLPMNICQLRSLSVPPGSEHERRTIIADELSEEWADRRQPMEFDFWEMDLGGAEKSGDAFNVSVLAASRLWVSQLWRDCRQSGLDCWAIDGTPLAMARAVALVGGATGGRRALAVDWGYSNTTLCVVGEGRPLYSRRIQNCSFGRVLEAIMNVFDISLDEAQHLVETQGVVAQSEETATGAASSDAATQTTITDAATGSVDELVRQISRTLQFMEMQRRHLQPAAIWLLGGGASMRNVAAYLANLLPLPVHAWNISTGPPAISCAAGLRSAVFGGAAALSALAWRAA